MDAMCVWVCGWVQMLHECGMEPNMHLTCTNMETAKIEAALEGAERASIRNIVALRGDPPHGQDKWEATEGGFACALDLVKCVALLCDCAGACLCMHALSASVRVCTRWCRPTHMIVSCV